MYLGAGLALVGAALFYESWALLGYCAVFTLVMFLFVVVYEEPRLRATFGDAYVRYCERVQRWWPRLRGNARTDSRWTPWNRT